jgi:pantetheine-phosphate adenylyltransferase
MIASSLVKQIAKMGGDITLFIPREAQEVVAAALAPPSHSKPSH